jgi:succinate-semialdehyde dehydrogenase/glutarate-semialdehyde dehydrogenase
LSSRLRNPQLLQSLLDGSFEQRAPQDHFEVRDPADPRSVIARVRAMDREDARRAIERSSAALPSWRDTTTAAHRSSLLLRWSRLIQENAGDIARIMTLESGKTLAESRGEIAYGVSFLDYYAAEAIRPSSAGGGFVVPTPFSHPDGAPRGQVLALQQAVGVCALIAPWNFPIAMVRPLILLPPVALCLRRPSCENSASLRDACWPKVVSSSTKYRPALFDRSRGRLPPRSPRAARRSSSPPS